MQYTSTVAKRFKSVYFILNDRAGAVKIGNAMRPVSRMRELQTASPDTLELLLVLSPQPYQRNADWFAEGKEDALHLKFKKYHIRGEWFEFSEEIRDFVTLEHIKQTCGKAGIVG